MLTRISFLILPGIAVAMFPLLQAKSQTGSDPGQAVPIRRIALLPPSASAVSDPQVQSLLAQLHADQDRAHRKRTLPRAETTGPSTKPTLTLPVKPQKKLVRSSVDLLTPTQLAAFSDLYFVEALSQRLQTRYKITVVDPIQVQKALGDLHLTPELAARPDAAQKLCTRLDCDAILSADPARIQIRDAQTRDLVVRLILHVDALRDPNSVVTGIKHGKGGVKPVPLSLSTIPVAGSASTGHAFMRSTYAQSLPAMAKEATLQAAMLAVHSLSTGEIAPFMLPGDRLALAPILAPTRADALLFTPEGRQTVPGALQGLSADVSSFFQPELLPLFPADIRDYDATSVAMQRLKMPPALLWEPENRPNVPQIQRLGRALNVSYLLVARVTDLEIATTATPSALTDNYSTAPALNASQSKPDLDDGNQKPLSPGPVRTIPPSDWQRQSHAEAIGAIVRIRDGNILWLDRGVADFTSRHVVIGARANDRANRQIASEAVKFALIDLKRHLKVYRSSFEQ